MEKNKQKVNDQVFSAWDQGFTAGQKAMIATIEEMGLINGKMAEFLEYAVKEVQLIPADYIAKTEMIETVNRITQNIMQI